MGGQWLTYLHMYICSKDMQEIGFEKGAVLNIISSQGVCVRS